MFSPVALFGIGIVSCVMSVGVLASLLRARVPGLARWMSAYAFVGLGFAILVWLGDGARPVTIASSNAMMLAGSFLVLQGTRQFLAYRRPTGRSGARSPQWQPLSPIGHSFRRAWRRGLP